MDAGPSACLRVGDDGVYGVGGEQRDGDNGDGVGELTPMPAYEVKLNGVVDQDGVVGLGGGVWQRHFGSRDGGGRGDNADVQGDGDAGRVC